jgi:hypothetical protein
MTRVEQLMSQPQVAQGLLRQVISTTAGNSTSFKVNEKCVLKATVLKQSSGKSSK